MDNDALIHGANVHIEINVEFRQLVSRVTSSEPAKAVQSLAGIFTKGRTIRRARRRAREPIRTAAQARTNNRKTAIECRRASKRDKESSGPLPTKSNCADFSGRASVARIARELRRSEAAVRYKAHTLNVSLALKR